MQQTIDLRVDNPYAYGTLSLLKDGTYCLEATKETPDLSGCRYYTTIQGDTFSNIAFEAYGNSKYWWLIWAANDFDCPFNLEITPNTTLRIPNIALL